MSWEIISSEDTPQTSCSNSKTYTDNRREIETCCARTYKSTLKCSDQGKNGWNNGYLTINGKPYCQNWSGNPEEQIYDLDLAGMSIYDTNGFFLPYCKTVIL